MIMIDQVIQAATMALGFLTWGACACRIGDMHPSTHRIEAIAWHAVAAGLALWVNGMAVWRPGDVLSFWTALALWGVMWRTWGEWSGGVAPAWTWRPEHRPVALPAA